MRDPRKVKIVTPIGIYLTIPSGHQKKSVTQGKAFPDTPADAFPGVPVPHNWFYLIESFSKVMDSSLIL